MGLTKTPFCRPPLAELDAKYYSDVEAALEGAGLLGIGDVMYDSIKTPVPAGMSPPSTNSINP